MKEGRRRGNEGGRGKRERNERGEGQEKGRRRREEDVIGPLCLWLGDN